MEKSRPQLSPLLIVVCGIAIAGLSLIIQGTFSPYGLIGFILAAFFELFFRKEQVMKALFRSPKKVPSYIFSFALALLVTLALKNFVFDFKIMARDLPKLGLKKDARIFYQPSMFRLREGDKVFVRDEDGKYYVAQVEAINNGMCKLYLSKTDSMKEVPRNEIKGKIVYILQQE